MKRLLLFVSCVLIGVSAFSQNKEWKVKGVEPQVRLSVDEGLDAQKNLSFGADFIAAYRFNEWIRIGAGVGINYINMRFEDAKYSYRTEKFEPYYEPSMTIPVFANIKADFLQRKASPYLAVDCGYNFFVGFSKGYPNNKLGFFVRPALGVDIRFKKCVLFIELAYRYQSRSYEDLLVTYGSYHQLSQAIGLSF